MASSQQVRDWYSVYRCEPSRMVRVNFPGAGKVWPLQVASATVPAWEAFAAVMASTGYYFREIAGGTYNCRKIAGSSKWSLHAYGVALDLNPNQNPYGSPLRHDYPAAFLNGIAGIKTTGGLTVFTWGGTWNTPDAMHWQINVPPAAIAKGIVWQGTPATGKEYTMQITRTTIRLGTEDAGAYGGLVATAQALMVSKGYWSGSKVERGTFITGKFDATTDAVVRAFQKDKKLGVDGIVGPNTWAALESS